MEDHISKTKLERKKKVKRSIASAGTLAYFDTNKGVTLEVDNSKHRCRTPRS